MAGLINWGAVGTPAPKTSAPPQFSGSRINWGAINAQAVKAPAPFNIKTISDVPSLNKALHAGQINQSQWMNQFKQIQAKTNAPKIQTGIKAVPGSLGTALNKVIVQPAINTVKTPINAASLLAAEATHNNKAITKSTGAFTNATLGSYISPLAQTAIMGGTNLAANKILNNKTYTPQDKAAALKNAINPSYGKVGFNTNDSSGKTKLKEASLLAQDIATPILTKGGMEAVKGIRSGSLADALTQAKGSAPTPRSALDKHIVPGETKGSGTISKFATANANVESPSIEKAVGTIKNPKVPEAIPQTTIPKEGRFQHLISVSGDLSRQGKSGQEIADRLGKAETASETGQAKFLQQVPTVTKLKSKDFSKFTDTLDNLSKNEGKPAEQNILNSLDPKTKQAVTEWSNAIPQVRQRAEAAGVDVGDLGKYYFPRNYTKLLSSRKGITEAAKQLVASGQAEDFGKAVQQLRYTKSQYATPFGHFDYSRSVDLPGYDKSKNALVNYVAGAYNKIGHAEHFGPKGEVADNLIGNIAAEGRDADRALKNYQIATGQYKYHTGPASTRALEAARGYNRVTKLGLSSILNATQSVNTAAVGGVIRTAKAALKQLSSADRQYVESTGVRVESVINALREQTGAASKIGQSGNFVKKVLGKTLNAPGFGQVEKFNRGVAAVAGRDYARTLAKRGTARSISVLRDKLGVEGTIGKTLTPEQEIQAGRKMVELTQFKTGGKDLPGWADSPMGKTVAQFRTFSYKQTGFVYNQLIREAIKNHNPVPLMRFIAVGTPVGIAAGGARNVLGGKPFYGSGTQGESDFKKFLGATYQGSSNVGGTGLAGSGIFLAQNAKSPNITSYVAGDVGGPTAGLAATVVKAGNNKKNVERLGLGQVPVAGPYLKSKLTPFGTAQQQAFDTASKGDNGVAKTLKKASYVPLDPSDARSKALAKNNPKQYQQFLSQSNKVFVEAIKKAQNDPNFKSKDSTQQKRDLSTTLSKARQKILNQMNVPKVQKVKQPKSTSYVQ